MRYVRYGHSRGRVGAGLVVAAALLAGCSDDGDPDPLVGEWQAYGAQPAGHADFGAGSMIRVGDDGKAVLGTSPSRLCGNAEVTADEDTGEDADENAGEDAGKGSGYLIAFPTGSPCLSVDVPRSLEVTLDGDMLEARPTGAHSTVYRFRRAD